MSGYTNVIRRPVISEKSTMLAEIGRRYVFEVETFSTKPAIKKAVEELFSVKVMNVKTLLMHGKVKRSARAVVKKPNWKKAIVTLAEGHKIEFFQTK